jgi:putative mRNA 3-end processing factor
MTDAGLYSPQGGFHIDPWRGVDRAIITHAHADHARRGSRQYLTATPGVPLLQARLGIGSTVEGLDFGQSIDLSGVRVSLHPAGHILGSAQVRLEYQGQVCVIAGDYKLDVDPTCSPFEPVPCHTFVTESTFGLPVYRWESPSLVLDSIHRWWIETQAAGRTSLLLAYSLGKSQRLLAGLDPTIGPILTHGAIETMTQLYRDLGVSLPPTLPLSRLGTEAQASKPWRRGLVLAPPSALGSPWARKLEPMSTAIASGWMQVRGARRRRAVDRGFVLSDHADWPGLLRAIGESRAERVLCTHGFSSLLARHLRDQGLDADLLTTRFGDEEDLSDAGIESE